MLISDRIAQPFWGDADQGVQFWAGHTFGGNPVSCAVSEAVVRWMLDHDLIGNADADRRLSRRQAGRDRHRTDVVREIRGVGMLRAFAFHEPIGRRGLRGRPPQRTAVAAGRRLGRCSRRRWCLTTAEADEIAQILEASVAEVVG